MLPAMSLIFRRLVQLAAQRLAEDPALRAKAVTTARAALDEARKVAQEEDRARAAGRAVRRAFNKLPLK